MAGKEEKQRERSSNKDKSVTIDSPKRREEVEEFLNGVDGLIRRYNPHIGNDQSLYTTPVISANLSGDPIKISVLGNYTNGQIASGVIRIQREIRGKQRDILRGLKRDDLPDERTMRLRKSLLKAVTRLYSRAPEASSR
jgi:hypothetical protein